ncbi:MAG: LLM class F420-dependent oxidoreductase [Caldilineaceae bacterium]|nr:LLM class F420-dependent oxidoreductase [Caldilineaceae bacterium]
MQFGVVFPQTEIGDVPRDIRDYAQTVEGLGFDYLLAYEHVVGANPDRPGGWEGRPYDHNSMFHEPFVLFGYLAALTERIRFMTGIVILPQRQTVLLAKQAATLDVLSGGRLTLGVGVGWNEVEYTALNEDFHTRGRRQAEQVAVLRALWTQRLVIFQGQYHTIPDAGLYPLPIQQPIPIWFGGGSDAALRRMARLGDGWMTNTGNLDQLAGELATLRGYISDAGRDPAAFGVEFHISLNRHPENEWPQTIERLAELGVSHVSINTMGRGLEGVGAHLAAIRRFADGRVG